MYYVYLLLCEGGELYAGITTDPDRRFSEHSSGIRGAKYTKAHRPMAYAAVWEAGDRSSASKLERKLKRLPHRDKVRIAAGEIPLPDDDPVYVRIQ